ncbi:MAG: 2-oxo acid dehydrogenase subunit E2 [Acidimicrobiales bacterium]|nr:2-oxo acid dehydrogenase subunit E2 [Acidimicrobiales bacterium]
MTEFRLPDVGEGLEQAEILEWLVAVGETVERDQPLVEILTDKSQTQLPSPVRGTVVALGAQVGDIVEVGSVLVTYEATDASNSAAAQPSEPSSPTDAPEQAPPTQPTTSTTGRAKASPAVRKRALAAGVDLATVEATGPGGRVTADDLDAHLAARSRPIAQRPAPSVVVRAPATPGQLGQAEPGVVPLRGIRRVTALAMERSWQIPHIHGNDEFDATALLDARRALRDRHGDAAAALTPLAFFVAAVAEALRAFPAVNSSIDTEAETITVHAEVNIGIAVAAPQGLLVPVLAGADALSLLQIASEIVRLTSAARDGSISTSDLHGGTCTITNYGSLGGRSATPIIRSPEAAIVGFGSIRPRPIVVDGQVVARPTLPIAVGADHRLIDGDLMTAFQERIIANLSNPIVMVAI